MTLLYVSLGLFICSLFAYLFKASKAGVILFVAGGLAAGCNIVREWLLVGQPPFSSMHHIMILLAACSLLAYVALVGGQNLRWLGTYLPLAGIIPLLLALFVFEQESIWHLAPALQSPWFIPHVMAYMVSYSLCLMAFLLLVVKQYLSIKDSKPELRKSLQLGEYKILSIAFPLMTFGLLSGALWANNIWGRYWSWDPKETWALITWSLYICYFHCRKSKKLTPYVNTSHFLGFLALVTTFLLVNILPKLASQLHSYV